MNNNSYKKKTKEMKIKRKQNPFSIFYESVEDEIVLLEIVAVMFIFGFLLPTIGYVLLQILHNVFGLSWTTLLDSGSPTGYMFNFYVSCWLYGLFTVILSPALIGTIWVLGVAVIGIIKLVCEFAGSVRAAHLPLTVEEIEKGNFESIWDIANFVRYMTTYSFLKILKKEKFISLSENIVQELCNSVFEFCKQKQPVYSNGTISLIDKSNPFMQSNFSLKEKSNILNAFCNTLAAPMSSSQLTYLLRIEYFLSKISKTHLQEIIVESFERHIFESDTVFDVLYYKEVLIYKKDSVKKTKCTFMILQNRKSLMCDVKVIRK